MGLRSPVSGLRLRLAFLRFSLGGLGLLASLGVLALAAQLTQFLGELWGIKLLVLLPDRIESLEQLVEELLVVVLGADHEVVARLVQHPARRSRDFVLQCRALLIAHGASRRGGRSARWRGDLELLEALRHRLEGALPLTPLLLVGRPGPEHGHLDVRRELELVHQEVRGDTLGLVELAAVHRAHGRDLVDRELLAFLGQRHPGSVDLGHELREVRRCGTSERPIRPIAGCIVGLGASIELEQLHVHFDERLTVLRIAQDGHVAARVAPDVVGLARLWRDERPVRRHLDLKPQTGRVHVLLAELGYLRRRVPGSTRDGEAQ